MTQNKNQHGTRSFDWSGKSVLVTGGASFIGSHVVDRLVERGARHVRVVDDLSSGTVDNIKGHIDSGVVELVRADLLAPGATDEACRGIDYVFHLAAIHGGRGYVEMHDAECGRNLVMDGLMVKSAIDANVDKFVFASSGCVYPNYIQQDISKELYLTEEMVGPPYDSDHMYGWAKLMGELALQSWHRQIGLRSVSCRLFTVYGERGVENHAVIAMIARAFIDQNPFEVWGDGTQIRNWTYVGDIADGMVAAAESDVVDGTPINLGTMERTRVIDAVHEVLRYTNKKADIKFLTNMPTGPLNRVASNQRAKDLIGWSPQMKFFDGLHRTIDWYFSTKEPEVVRGYFGRMLTERGESKPEPAGAAKASGKRS
ncbi:MAG: NAD-dependent epimerase/dehydratase family protein [Chloroflexi bacterium]|nr:MAG: GDP-L-fucose synthase 1 [Actinobacteria bacterium 13_2_20CM_2_66_6]TMD36133.1 MAG: NAD-dependent epimerase/dehydratase family protein [Chloroflexota bacterium]TMD73805.1 MAG: NAD-dependent epimerase/dehydratase family protein [Chloroflexota bacterium]